ncbi:MAG: winged helix-turn-helix transcriptional regulator [Flavobacteriaceae bacterium]|nr:winged helix-turn-helix transcriptional regulator [Flavobacteriaceae bacterium]
MEQTSCIRIKADVNQIENCKGAITALDGSFEYLSNALSLAGNNVRLKILFLLHQEQKLCVCDLSDILSMKVSAISQHLRKLKDRNIIHSKRDAQIIFYSLSAEYEELFKPFFALIDNNILEEA